MGVKKRDRTFGVGEAGISRFLDRINRPVRQAEVVAMSVIGPNLPRPLQKPGKTPASQFRPPPNHVSVAWRIIGIFIGIFVLVIVLVAAARLGLNISENGVDVQIKIRPGTPAQAVDGK